MWLIHAALRRPITILVAVIGVALCSILAITRMPVDTTPTFSRYSKPMSRWWSICKHPDERRREVVSREGRRAFFSA